jgi:hypothetical protein
MSQSAMQVSTTSPMSGLAVMLGVNGALAALATLQSGTTQPSLFSTGSTALREGQMWLDTGVIPHVVRRYDGTAFRPTFLSNPAPDVAYLASNFGVL